ncbi:poly-gamma-glutamate hydrolase family protein [Haloarchaeobius baliensis]|uniref:poly-gamma-glutamate hydrolase family protein n=1 Tax=Haloarchaeobius baliensis TaxID=1670458 RepID=UPI003F8857D7
MTGDYSNDDDESNGISRRSALAGMLTVPAVAAVGVGATEALTRPEPERLVAGRSRLDDDEPTVDVTVDFPETGVAPGGGLTEVTVDPALLSAVDVTVGDQVRLWRDDGAEYAVYTIDETIQDDDDNRVRIARRGRCRLALNEVDYVQDGDACPRPSGGCSIGTEVFESELDPVVPHPSYDEEEAKANGELIERVDGDGDELAVLAPNGGDIEPQTADQAEHAGLSAEAATTVWRTRGYRPGGDAYVRWHVPSDDISGNSYPELGGVLGTEYDQAVSFHGTCTSRVFVGGGASIETKTAVRDAIDEVLPLSFPSTQVGDGRYARTDPDVLVNRAAGDGGVWVGQPRQIRDEHADEVAEAVVEAL